MATASAGGGDALTQQMAAMVGIVQRLSVSFEEVKKELAVVMGQVTGKGQAVVQTERLEGLKEGLVLTDGAAGARLAFPGNPDSVPVPHRTIARHWRVAASAAPKARLDASATVRQPGVFLEEARPTARTDQRPTFDAANIRAVVHDGATWPDHADEEPGFPQLLITPRVLARQGAPGYQAAAAYAEALDAPDERVRRALQAAETAATPSKGPRPHSRAGDGVRARRRTASTSFRWGRRGSNGSTGRRSGSSSNATNSNNGYNKKPSADRK